MARKYDRVIRYYASWFDDILDPAKEFTDSEFKQIFLAIRDVQIQGRIDPLLELPITIRRALSMATMGEQIMRLLERSERMRQRGSAGGRATAAQRNAEEPDLAAAIGEQLRAMNRAQRQAEMEEQKRKAVNPNQYVELLAKGSNGDAEALALLRCTQEEAKNTLQSHINRQKRAAQKK